MRNTLIVFALLNSVTASTLVLAQTADSIYLNGRIYTANASQPWVEAVAIKDGRFLHVGDGKTALLHRGPTTNVYELDGQMAMPGIHDAHSHMLWAGLSNLFGCRLPRGEPLEKLVSKLQECARGQRQADWLIADSVWSTQFPGGRFHRSHLDAVFPDKPVYLVDGSYHHAYLNSAALKRAGIGPDTASPAGGEVILGVDGELTGELVESATMLVADYLPVPEDWQSAAAIRWSSRTLSSFGITSTQEASATASVLTALKAADSKNRLQQRVAAHVIWGSQKFSLSSQEQVEKLIQNRKQFASRHVSVDFAKMYIDGAPTPPFFTEAGIDPVTGAVARERILVEPGVLNEAVTRLDGMGIKVKMHVAGPGSARVALDAVVAARQAHPQSKIRHELAHSATLVASDIARMPALDMVAEMSPTMWQLLPHMTGSPPLPAWPFRTLQKHNVIMTIETDWSVTDDPNVFPSLQGILEHGDESLDLDAALKMLTINGALSLGWGQVQGSIEAGKLANLIVLDRNLFDVPTAKIGGTVVLKTVFEGNVVYDRAGEE